MELFYKLTQVKEGTLIHQKEYKGSEPLFLRRAALLEAEKLRDTVGQECDTVLVSLCFSPVGGFVTELPVFFIGGNEDLNMLAFHSWQLETSLYYQYGYDTGGDIATYMSTMVLPDVMEQAKEDFF